MFIKTEVGICNTDGLLTVSKSNASIYNGWAIILKYKNRKGDLYFKCKDEKQADDCINIINKALTGSSDLWGGSV